MSYNLSKKSEFLPISKDDMKDRGWKELDIILITGDAYVDHPSYGTAIIGRVLEDAGFRVGVISQPDWKNIVPGVLPHDFARLGKPRLFFGITAGNLDSIIANHTTTRNKRKSDDYSPSGKPGLRPNRASIVYSNRVREAFPDTPIVLGGIEASLRRLAHYDHWSDEVRASILVDSRADILVYGMGERQVVEIAKRLRCGEDLEGICGTTIIKKDIETLNDAVVIPSFEDVRTNKRKFNEAFELWYKECDPFHSKAVIQPHGNRFVVQFPAALPLSTEELDHIYLLPFVRRWHPVYDKDGGVPGFEIVRFSVTSHRGCCGQCSFCSLYAHQGRIVQSRSSQSIVKEIETIANLKEFKGTITDIGGPTANLYQASCKHWATRGACKGKMCLIPTRCRELKTGYGQTMNMWTEVMKNPKVNHLFVASGIRYDLLVENEAEKYLKILCKHHVGGQLKVAPEHTSDSVLNLMNKPSFKVYEKFEARFRKINKELNKKQYLVNYFISAHPGSNLEATCQMALY
ncbi:MAG: YgiQ family radical SAM protein, partial [bacterium]